MAEEKDLKKYLLQGGFVDDAKPVRSSDKDAISGRLNGYEVEFGIEYYPRINSAAVYYRVKLERPPKIPLFLWDKCPVGNLAHLSDDESRGYVTIRYGKWLYKTRELGSGEDEEVLLKKIPVHEVRGTFETLTRIASKIENGEISIKKAVTRARNTFLKELGIVLLMLAFAAVLTKLFLLK